MCGPDRLAQVGFGVQAIIAFAAFGRIERDHMIANRQAGHAWANLDHHAGPLMAKDRRENPLGVIARAGELVCVTQAGWL